MRKLERGCVYLVVKDDRKTMEIVKRRKWNRIRRRGGLAPPWVARNVLLELKKRTKERIERTKERREQDKED